MKILISWALLFSCVMASASPSIVPKFQDVELKEFTALQIEITPDAGTQLVFPFKLDNPDMQPPLKIQLTNKDGFSVPSQGSEFKELLVGQNTITIMGNVSEENSIYMGNLFITIGGYHITISLRTDYDVRHHVTNYVFKESAAERNYILENAVKNRVKDIEEAYRKKSEELLSDGGENMLSALNRLATLDMNKDRISERLKLNINGLILIADIAHFIKMGDQYGTLVFYLNNQTPKSFDVTGLAFYATDSDSTEMLIDGEYACESRLEAKTKIQCSFSSRDVQFITRDIIKFVLTTEQGAGEATW